MITAKSPELLGKAARDGGKRDDEGGRCRNRWCRIGRLRPRRPRSEDPSLRVVLLEAGPDYPDVATLPEELLDGWRPVHTHDWGYASEPREALTSIPLPRARVVGGSSATNALFALRGAVEDYDRWAELGNPGWSFEEVLPAFRRLKRDLGK
jgi:choline dehydrogenase